MIDIKKLKRIDKYVYDYGYSSVIRHEVKKLKQDIFLVKCPIGKAFLYNVTPTECIGCGKNIKL